MVLTIEHTRKPYRWLDPASHNTLLMDTKIGHIQKVRNTMVYYLSLPSPLPV